MHRLAALLFALAFSLPAPVAAQDSPGPNHQKVCTVLFGIIAELEQHAATSVPAVDAIMAAVKMLLEYDKAGLSCFTERERQ